ncbi:splicing coactivator subunit [Burkholderia pseudomallei]|nr:splicing coactivator subunit [Burkholderia pseudomallei]
MRRFGTFAAGLMGRVQQHLFAALGVTREPRTTH